MERGYGASSQTYPWASALCASRESLGTVGPSILPYLGIKLTFECTARFYGLAPPLALWELGPVSKTWEAYFCSIL